MPYYTDRDVKGSGTGGQFNPQSPKAIEALVWIYKQRPGRVIRRESVPVSHLLADGAIHEAIRMNLLTEQRVRTETGWHL